MKRVIFSAVAIFAIMFSSCSSDEVVTPPVEAPATYVFNRGGNTSVSYSGQTTRIKMAEELVSALKVSTNTKAKLDGMFTHAAGNNDFTDATLNTSSKNVRSKTAASADYFASNTTEANAIKAKFDGYISSQVSEVFPNWATNAVAGTAGKIQEAGGGSTRYVNAKGLEYNQAFAKSLIGALMVDQMLNNYLSKKVLDEATNVADNDAGTLATGKNYTTMEHKWDEAYGYLYGAEVDGASPKLGADSFLNKYLAKVDGNSNFKGIAKEIYEAFKLGRAAIVAKNYTLRDQQIVIIKKAVSKVIAVRAVHYLQAGKATLATDKASAFHDLSEGYGFVHSLRFTQDTSGKAHLPVAEIEGFLTALQAGNGFWTLTTKTLDDMSTRIAAVYGFTVDQAK
ncbi:MULTISPECIES: DUF4856 domain-containing protein [Tenacibaculum]|uniref:DUF4856 domain-containing protein n=1 Tax=Tenacibaculum TaxID=104267 RepID=UPI000DEAECF8|nr:DUF4856 domain-containing protein [Tenacibaculum sp. E3R01]RBW56648.1 DUF4856 domain-containing protein [Tenacibaculum sp. E3R01]